MPEETNTKAVKTARAVKAGDTVHFVHHCGLPGRRFDKLHADAKVVKVYPASKTGGPELLDLSVADLIDGQTGEATVIHKSPRDDKGEQADSWHPVEAEEPAK